MISSQGETAWLHQAFIDVQSELQLKLRRAAQSINHTGTHGGVSESHWIEVMRAYLPDRYKVDSGFVIDSRGCRSEQIDIIIFDRHFTPTLLDQQHHRYVPAEAVYAVFESRPEINKSNLEYAGSKAASVRHLYRTSIRITHAGGHYEPRLLFPFVAGIVASRAGWADGLGATFREVLPQVGDSRLDCGCCLVSGAFDVFAGELSISPADTALIHFLFRLLGKLQSLGSVPAIDWSAYAEVLHDPHAGDGEPLVVAVV
jgi:hypothetical protein